MATLDRIELNNNPSQDFSTVVDGDSVDFEFRYNVSLDRFYFNLFINDIEMISGRILNSDVDLLKGYPAVNIGSLFCKDYDLKERTPNLENISSGDVRVYIYKKV